MIRAYILWLFIASTVMLVVTIIRFFWESIISKTYKTFMPQKTVKCVMHYPNSMIKNFWRLLPDDDLINIKHQKYIYSNTDSQKHKDKFFLLDEEHKERFCIIDNIRYDFKRLCLIKSRFDQTPEIHYIHNNPLPIDFGTFLKKSKEGTTEVQFSAKQLEQIKENDLFTKLLSADFENAMLKVLVIIGMIIVCGVGFLIALQMGIIEVDLANSNLI